MELQILSGLAGNPRNIPPVPYGAAEESAEMKAYCRELYLEAFRVNYLGVGFKIGIGSQPATYADGASIARTDWRRYHIAYLNTANAMKIEMGTDEIDLADVLTEVVVNTLNGKKVPYNPNTFTNARQGLALIMTWMREPNPGVSGLMGLFATSYGPMQIPFSDRDHWSPADVQQTVNPAIKRITQAYGTLIDQMGELTNVPTSLIKSIIVKESEGDALANIRPHRFNGQAKSKISAYKGLMQISAPVAMTAIFESRKIMSGELRDLIEQHIGPTATSQLLNQVKNQSMVIAGSNGKSIQLIAQLGRSFNQLLANPQFNILCGTLYLSYLLRRNADNSPVRLARVVAQYNGGHNLTVRGDTLAEVRASINAYPHYQASKKKEILTYIDALGGPRYGILTLLS